MNWIGILFCYDQAIYRVNYVEHNEGNGTQPKASDNSMDRPNWEDVIDVLNGDKPPTDVSVSLNAVNLSIIRLSFVPYRTFLDYDYVCVWEIFYWVLLLLYLFLFVLLSCSSFVEISGAINR
jgi:hypothetical protein